MNRTYSLPPGVRNCVFVLNGDRAIELSKRDYAKHDGHWFVPLLGDRGGYCETCRVAVPMKPGDE